MSAGMRRESWESNNIYRGRQSERGHVCVLIQIFQKNIFSQSTFDGVSGTFSTRILLPSGSKETLYFNLLKIHDGCHY